VFEALRSFTARGVTYAPGDAFPTEALAARTVTSLANGGWIRRVGEGDGPLRYVALRVLRFGGQVYRKGTVVPADALPDTKLTQFLQHRLIAPAL
jgi:hypothetical protein